MQKTAKVCRFFAILDCAVCQIKETAIYYGDINLWLILLLKGSFFFFITFPFFFRLFVEMFKKSKIFLPALTGFLCPYMIFLFNFGLNEICYPEYSTPRLNKRR